MSHRRYVLIDPDSSDDTSVYSDDSEIQFSIQMAHMLRLEEEARCTRRAVDQLTPYQQVPTCTIKPFDDVNEDQVVPTHPR